MSERTLASEVAVSEQDAQPRSPDIPTKRRQSSVSEHETKRRRLSSQGDLSPDTRRSQYSPPASGPDRPIERRPIREEDRKRGQRLFGGLLGTLSQKSATAAQKRRADIEKRQQDKLKSEADEYDGLKKRQKERRDVIRRKEKPFFEREAMQARHANLIAMAHFLKTRTEPVLYYKPWQLRSGDEAVIREQIDEAEATVAREVAEFNARYPPDAFAYEKIEPISTESTGQPLEAKESAEQQQQQQQEKPVAESISEQAPVTQTEPLAEKQEETYAKDDAQPDQEDNSKPIQTDAAPSEAASATNSTDAHRSHHDDDGDEMLEDNEDTVIY